MVRIEQENVSYRELMVIDSDGSQHTCDCLGISAQGELLFILEREVRSGNAYALARTFFLINREEYLSFLATAAKNLRLQRSLSKGETELEVSCAGKYFHVGTSIEYIIHHRECSIFTGDAGAAEEYGFSRVDKFEYEKTIRIKDCDAVRITHKDAMSDVVFVQQEFEPADFESWLDGLRSDAEKSAGPKLMNDCPTCGKKNAGGKYCTDCGAKLLVQNTPADRRKVR